MAPVTRNRKAKAANDDAAAVAKPAVKAKAAAATSASKRKAVEDASPVAPKKAKAVKESEPSPTILKNGSLPEKKQKTKSTKSSKKEKAQVREEEEAGEEPEPEPESAPVAAAAADDENDDEHPFSEEEEDDEANALAEAVNSDEEDAPLDGAAGALFKPGQDVGKAPKPAAKASKKASGAETGVLYVGHIPHGFYEHEMRSYFSQFGMILRLRLSRSKRTGASKHFAFLEFEDAAVAEVVQKTMDNYLLFGHVLKCKVVPKSQIHENLWKGANKRFKKVPHNKLAGNALKKPLTETAWARKISREDKKRQSRAKRLLDMGYEFEAPKLKDAEAPAPAALEGADAEDAPKAIEAPPPADAAEEDVAEEAPAVKKPVEKSEESTATKSAVKKSKKGSKAKKPKA